MARKVNKKFFILVFGALGGLAVLAFAVGILRRHGTQYYLARANAAVERGDLPAAVDWVGRAVYKDRSNKELLLKLGDLYNQMVAQDPAYLQKAISVWRVALELDPAYQPALDRVVDEGIAEFKAGGNPRNLIDVGEMAVKAYPDNERYQSVLYMATLRQWVGGAAFSNAEVDRDIKALAAAAQKAPDDADAALYASQAQLKRASDLRTASNIDQAHSLFDEVAARHQALIKARPQNPAVQLRASQVFAALGQMDDRAERRSAYHDLRKTTIEAAFAQAKPSDEIYDETQPAYAAWLAAGNAPRAAVEKVYRDWVKARPTSPVARIELAQFLGLSPAQRPEAIQILSSPMPADPHLQGFAALRVRQFQRAALIELDTLRVEDARVAAAKDRDALLAKIDPDLTRIAQMGLGEDFQYLKLRGKVQMLHADAVEAVKSFERARTLLGQQFDGDLWANLEDAYLRTGQSGTAEQLMEQLLARAPGYAALRAKLAELYIENGQLDQAATQLAALQAIKSNDPQIIEAMARLAVVVHARQGHLDQARQERAALPEKTREDRLFKARLALETQEPADVARLAHDLLHDNPADPEAVSMLIDQSLRENNIAQAKQVVADALQRAPNDAGLLALRDRLAVSSPDQMRKWQDELVQKTEDPVLRSLRQAQVALGRNDYDEAARALDAAEKIKADDPRLFDMRLQWYTRQGKFDQAVPLVEKAAAANADRMDGLLIRTQFAFQRGNIPQALGYGQDLVGKYKEFAANWVMLARVQQAAGRYSEAISSFDQALTRQPSNLEAMRGKAGCLDSLGQFLDERAVIEAARRLAPEDLALRDQALNFELRHGDPDKVVQECQDIMAKEPQNAAVYAALGQAYVVSGQTKHGNDTAVSKQYFEKARKVLDDGMVKFANTPDERRFFAPLSQVLDALGDAPGAEKLLKQFAARPDEKDSPGASRELAVFLERHHRLPEAEQAWRDAYAKSHNSVDIELELAGFLSRINRPDDALKVLEAVSNNPRVVNQRIDTLIASGRLTDARKIVDQTLAANSADPAALYYRGLIAFLQNNTEEAVNDLSDLRKKDPRNVAVRLWLGRAQLARGNRDAASAELEAALQIAPLRDDVRITLINAYGAASDPRWDDYDRVIADAQANPSLSSEPAWSQLHAVGLARRGLFQQALVEIQAARKLAPNDIHLWDDQVDILLQARDWQGVLRETDAQIAAGHKPGAVYARRGAARNGLGDKIGAMNEFETGLAAEKTAANRAGIASLLRAMADVFGADEALVRLDNLPSGPIRDLLAMDLYGQKKDISAQSRAAEAALAENLTTDQRALALKTDAEDYLQLNQLTKARAVYDELLKVRPDDVPTLNNVAYLLAETLNEPQSAKWYSGRAYDLSIKAGGDPRIADTHGWILTLCGGHDAYTGLQILQNLVETDKNYTKARYHLAEAYLRMGKLDVASDELTVVQDQIKQLEQNHRPVDEELRTGVKKALEELRQKTTAKSQASSK